MPNVHSSAGVYSQTIDLSVRGQPVSKDVAVVVGSATKGELNKRILITSTVELEQKLGKSDPRLGFGLFAAKQYLTVGSRLYYTRVASGALTAGAYLTTDDPAAVDPILSLNVFDDGQNLPRGVEDPLNTLGFSLLDQGIDRTLLYFTASSPGEWAKDITIIVRPSNAKGTPIRNPQHDTKLFYVDVYVNYTGLGSLPQESFLVTRHQQVSNTGESLFIEDVINTKSSLIRVKNNPYMNEIDMVTVTAVTLNGGTSGTVSENDILNGWNLYKDVDEVEVNILINAGYSTPAVQRKMDEVCQTRGDCIALLDMPSDKQTVSAAVNYRRNELNLNSHYSAIYSPDLQIIDPDTNMTVFVPPSGHAAAALAYTIATRELWYAPAGLQRGKVKILGVRERYNQGARDALDLAQINMIRQIPNSGYVIWGQETLQSFASALSNINVVNLVNYVLKVSTKTAQVAVFDPNDAFLRAELVSIITRIVDPIKRGRGVYDYLIVCDETNNTPETIANGDVILDMYLDPTIPAKRIHFTVGINPTGSRLLFLNSDQ